MKRWTLAEPETARLNRWADRLLGIPFDYYRKSTPKRPLPELMLTDLERLELAKYLRHVAADPRAMAAIVRIGTKRGAPRSRDMARVWKIALDLQLTQERLGPEMYNVAIIEVGDAWNGPGATEMKRMGKTSGFRRLRTVRGGRILQSDDGAHARRRPKREVVVGWNSVGKRVQDAHRDARRHPLWDTWVEYDTNTFAHKHPRLKGNKLSEAHSKYLRQSA